MAPPLSANPFVSVSALRTKSPVVTLKIRPLALPFMVVFAEPFPVTINDLLIVISPPVRITLVTAGANVMVPPTAAAAIWLLKVPADPSSALLVTTCPNELIPVKSTIIVSNVVKVIFLLIVFVFKLTSIVFTENKTMWF